MQKIQTDILVIGGGATGIGVLRDLAMRGFQCLLVERRDITYGTSGRFHGLLHSGSRYVVNDPQSAKECFTENQILRRIMPQCIEDTGGFFVLTPIDEPEYVPLFIKGCETTGIPIEGVSIHSMQKQEPLLNSRIQQCFHVPDASVDSFLAGKLNAESAIQYGAKLLLYHQVTRLMVSRNSASGFPKVIGAYCHDLVNDEDVQIDATLVINASGAWAGKIAQTAGINLKMKPGKGTLVAFNHRMVNTVINRCRLPSDGDILVPTHTVAVMGTTDIEVDDPDHYSIEPWEIRLLLDEGEKIIPTIKQFRILRTWAGLRPLVRDNTAVSDRETSRVFVLIDHAKVDNVEGLITITSGKWTTYRKMAEVCVDKVCEKLRTTRPCRTHLEPLPDKSDKKKAHYYLGSKLNKIESKSLYGELICECELVTEEDLEKSIIDSNVMTLDDIRRETRLGMGPCQGAFCTIRAICKLHSLRQHPSTEINTSLRDFIQERWKGNLPILSDQQLRQSRFNEFIYINTLNATSLPGHSASRLAADEYTRPIEKLMKIPSGDRKTGTTELPLFQNEADDVIIIGAGIAGLIAAWCSSLAGNKTKIITKGWGTPYWSSGGIDIIGYQPPDYRTPVNSPIEFLSELIYINPIHPYSFLGLSKLEEAVQSFLKVCDLYRYPYFGSLDKNIWLPTSLGTIRPSCLVPATMIAGDVTKHSPMLIVGFTRFLDFSAKLVADNLNAQGILGTDVTLDLKSLQHRRFIYGLTLAKLFDTPEFRQEIIEALKPKLPNVSRIGFPAVLGLNHSIETKDFLEQELGLPIFEIPGIPPSIPGIRLQNLLISVIEQNHGLVINGMQVSNISFENSKINAIFSDAASRQKTHLAKIYILATGGILGGGINVDKDGYAQELIFGLPVKTPEDHNQWFSQEFLSLDGHPIFQSGITVNDSLQPVDEHELVNFQNLYAIGSIIGNFDPIRERSLEGISLITGYAVTEFISRSK